MSVVSVSVVAQGAMLVEVPPGFRFGNRVWLDGRDRLVRSDFGGESTVGPT